MGWSCTRAASNTLEAFMNRFRHQNSANTYTFDAGKTVYFHEIGREQRDGAITGVIFKFIGTDGAQQVGRFRIAPDGKIERWSGFSRKLWEEIRIKGVDDYNKMIADAEKNALKITLP